MRVNGGSIPTLSIQQDALEVNSEEERAPLDEILGLDALTGNKSLGWCFRGCIEDRVVDVLGIVIAEDWPSWALVLRGLGWNRLFVLVKNKLKYKKLWKSKDLFDLDLLAWSELKGFLKISKDSLAWVWMEGSKAFLSQSIKTLMEVAPGLKRIGVCLEDGSFGEQEVKGEWVKLAHEDVGGLTTSLCWVYAPGKPSDLLLENQSGVRRSLKHVLDPLEKGRLGRPVDLENPRVLHPDDRIRWDAKAETLWVLAPSVFHKGLVVRQLSLKELFGIYDVPKDIRHFFKSRRNLPFSRKTPLKLLAQVGMMAVRALPIKHAQGPVVNRNQDLKMICTRS